MRKPIETGDVWGFREGAWKPGKQLQPVEIIRFGPSSSRKIRVMLLEGEYEGLDRWVVSKQLPVPWEEATAFLDDERRYHAAMKVSYEAVGSLEFDAAEEIFSSHPHADWLNLTSFGRESGTVTISEPEVVLHELALSLEDLIEEPHAFIERHGAFVGPWAVALRVAQRIATVYSYLVLDHVAERLRKLRRDATYGTYRDYGREKKEILTPPEFWAARLHEQEPVFALVREWCGAEGVSKYDVEAESRAELNRLRTIVLAAAQRVEDLGDVRSANRFRRQVGYEPGKTRKRKARK